VPPSLLDESSMTVLSEEAVERLGSPLAKQVDFHEEIGSTQERARELATRAEASER